MKFEECGGVVEGYLVGKDSRSLKYYHIRKSSGTIVKIALPSIKYLDKLVV